MDPNCLIVDAFATEPGTGNAAAVVLDEQTRTDEQMQAIAAKLNLSETTFILPTNETPPPNLPNAKLNKKFRWFTPTVEVDMCGHATIAGIHALLETGRLPAPKENDATLVNIQTASGWLTGYVEPIPGQHPACIIWLDLVDPVLQPANTPLPELADTLSIHASDFDPAAPPARSQDHDLIAFVKDFQTLMTAQPDFARLGRLLESTKMRGLCLATTATLTPAVQVQSRFFAPTCGVNEDPVTGSVHGPLGACLLKTGRLRPNRDGLAGIQAIQGIPGGRTGLVRMIVQQKPDNTYAARIGGRAFTTGHEHV